MLLSLAASSHCATPSREVFRGFEVFRLENRDHTCRRVHVGGPDNHQPIAVLRISGVSVVFMTRRL